MECVSDWQPVISALPTLLGMVGIAGLMVAYGLMVRMLN